MIAALALVGSALNPGGAAAHAPDSSPSASSSIAFPRIANLWGSADASQVASYAAYDLFIPYSWRDGPSQAAAIRAANPNTRILLWQNAADSKTSDAPASGWLTASPGEPAYACLLRNSRGEVLLTRSDHNVMFNVTDAFCREALVAHNAAAWTASAGEYDGLYWDRLGSAPPYAELGDDIDANLDGAPDAHPGLDAAYEAGMRDYLDRMRAALPNVIIMGNDASTVFQQWLNGRFVEWQLPYILDGHNEVSWYSTMSEYRSWAERAIAPPTTFIAGSSEKAYERKYGFDNLAQMPPAMEAEAAASYQSMRYSLTTALMGNGLFCYDFGGYHHGNLWWYDEYGRRPGIDPEGLPEKGYLGAPLAAPVRLAAGVWARSFERGLAVINTTLSARTIALPHVYQKLNGSQAPLFQVRVDDEEAAYAGEWGQAAASFSQFGTTVHEAAGDAGRTATYRPELAYAGEYELLAWVAPAGGQSGAATYTVHHRNGDTDVVLDQTAGDVGWHSLGKFDLAAGSEGSVTLKATGGGKVVADALKWVSTARYNDGQLVREVTLQAQDGIVMLAASAPAPSQGGNYQVFVPSTSRQSQ